MAALPEQVPTGMTEAEYLELECTSEIKYEYAGGEVFAMTGASWNHNIISVNTSTRLNIQLVNQDCGVTGSDLRLKVIAEGSYRYPDIMVICGEPQFVDDRVDTVSNPTVVIEVVSPSTALVDRNDKLNEYLQLDSLQEYILISQHEARVERYLRHQSDWLYTQVAGLQNSLDLPSISCTLKLSDIYQKVSFAQDSSPDPV